MRRVAGDDPAATPAARRDAVEVGPRLGAADAVRRLHPDHARARDLPPRLFALALGGLAAAVAVFLFVQLRAWPPHEDETLALFVGRQTDVNGVPWIAVVVWAFVGAELSRDSANIATLV